MKNQFVIDESLVKRLLSVVDAGLVRGLGSNKPGEMCVEAAICYALGEPHSDNPSCVAQAIRTAKITLNDCNWSSNQARTSGMRRAAIAQLGSKGVVNDVAFATRLAELTIQVIVPLASYAASYAARAASDAARAASDAANYAASAANYAARAANYAARAANYAASDAVLRTAAELQVQVMQELKSPGCEWLWLCDELEGK